MSPARNTVPATMDPISFRGATCGAKTQDRLSYFNELFCSSFPPCAHAILDTVDARLQMR